MKIIKKISLSFFFLFMCTNLSFGQAQTLRNRLETLIVDTEILKNPNRRIDATGSPYVNEDFNPLKIIGYKKNQLFSGRYNAFNGEMEVDLGGGKIIALPKAQKFRVHFTLSDEKYESYSFKDENGKDKNEFLVIIQESESFSLLREENIIYIPKIEPRSSYDQTIPASFKRENNTYYIKKGDIITHFPTKKKALLKAYPKHAKSIKTYLKENKLSTSKEGDLIKIAQYINTL